MRIEVEFLAERAARIREIQSSDGAMSIHGPRVLQHALQALLNLQK